MIRRSMSGLAALAMLALQLTPACSAEHVIRDVVYGFELGQTMDVYLPPDPKDAPVIVMVHGGAWITGDKSNAAVYANKAAHYLPKGYIFISVNNRLVPDADPLTQADDVANALAYAQTEAAFWGGDPNRFVLMGHSAGAHLVALVAADPAFAKHQGVKPWLGTIALDSGAFDVSAIMERRHARFYDTAFGRDPAYWRAASPLYRLTGAPAPMLLVCSSLSRESCAQAKRFASKVESIGGHATVLPERLRHNAINRNLGLGGAYTSAVDAFLAGLGLP